LGLDSSGCQEYSTKKWLAIDLWASFFDEYLTLHYDLHFAVPRTLLSSVQKKKNSDICSPLMLKYGHLQSADCHSALRIYIRICVTELWPEKAQRKRPLGYALLTDTEDVGVLESPFVWTAAGSEMLR